MKNRPDPNTVRFAAEGVLHCFRTQRHMQIHFLMLVLVLVSGLMLALDPRDMVMLLFAITLVIAMEMVNTAVESVVDMVATGYSSAAKLAKDVAAGAVLVAAVNAIITGVVIFFGAALPRISEASGGLETKPPDLTVVLAVGVLVMATLVIMTKVLTGRSNPELLRGGIISGHAAIGFFLAMTIVFTSGDRLVGLLALALAGLLAQSRVDAGIHTVQQVVLGAVLAVFLTASVYWLMPRVQAFLLRSAAQPQASIGSPLHGRAETYGGIIGRIGLRSST
ncbi:MAG: phosphatase PAP2 family protein [Chthonomonadales bacterium]|nr:phosphatase PAP2 family protein [Chthonomonadales bacterium]